MVLSETSVVLLRFGTLLSLFSVVLSGTSLVLSETSVVLLRFDTLLTLFSVVLSETSISNDKYNSKQHKIDHNRT